MTKTAVLIHGCHLQAEKWDTIVFGTPELPGRIPTGIRYAWQVEADMIYWGTGASERDGVKEAEATFQYALSRWDQLARFCGAIDESEFFDWLSRVSYRDIVSQNTHQEIGRCLSECFRRKIDQLVLVSSPTHLPRCLVEACGVAASNIAYQAYLYEGRILALPSATCFAGAVPRDVTVLEPPHRGDLPKPEPDLYPNVLAKRMFGLMRDTGKYFEFLREWSTLLRRYGV